MSSVLCSFARCWAGKVMQAGTSSSAPSIRAAGFGSLPRIWSATSRHCALAAA
jgi:hypothetical protein